MIENIFMCLSNFMVVYPLYLSWNQDIITFLVILNIGLASAISHLAECHKHGMSGIGLSQMTSYLLNRWDVISCVIVLIRIVQMFLDSFRWGLLAYLIYSLPLIVLLQISEHDKYNKNIKDMYLVTHAIWHMGTLVPEWNEGIFYLLGLFLTEIY